MTFLRIVQWRRINRNDVTFDKHIANNDNISLVAMVIVDQHPTNTIEQARCVPCSLPSQSAMCPYGCEFSLYIVRTMCMQSRLSITNKRSRTTLCSSDHWWRRLRLDNTWQSIFFRFYSSSSFCFYRASTMISLTSCFSLLLASGVYWSCWLLFFLSLFFVFYMSLINLGIRVRYWLAIEDNMDRIRQPANL
jgi:hypothetical protein